MVNPLPCYVMLWSKIFCMAEVRSFECLKLPFWLSYNSVSASVHQISSKSVDILLIAVTR